MYAKSRITLKQILRQIVAIKEALDTDKYLTTEDRLALQDELKYLESIYAEKD